MEKKANIFKRFKFYVKLGVLAATPIVLTSCEEEKNITPIPTTTIETVTPTETPTGELTPTPIEVVTPTPTEEPTPTPTIIPVSERKVSIDDIMLYENVIGDLYEEKEDFETEFNKKVQYYKSFNEFSDKQANVLVAFLNELHFVPENEELSQEIKDKYLLFFTKENADMIFDICEIINRHNAEHPDDIIMLAEGAIGEKAMALKDRAKLAEVQKISNEILNGNVVHAYELCNTREKYDYVLYSKERTRMAEVEFLMDDLNNPCKYLAACASYAAAKNAPYKNNNVQLAIDNLPRFMENSKNPLFNFERLAEGTCGWTGIFSYNYKYDPDYLNQK